MSASSPSHTNANTNQSHHQTAHDQTSDQMHAHSIQQQCTQEEEEEFKRTAPPPLPPLSSASAATAPSSPPPVVKHSHALALLQEMFPLLDKEVILFTLNENDRMLERTVEALTQINQIALRRIEGVTWPQGQRQGLGEHSIQHRMENTGEISADELERLKSEQRVHRAALQRSTDQGVFAKSKLLTKAEQAATKKGSKSRPAPPVFITSNRPATAEEVLVAAKGAEAFAQYQQTQTERIETLTKQLSQAIERNDFETIDRISKQMTQISILQSAPTFANVLTHTTHKHTASPVHSDRRKANSPVHNNNNTSNNNNNTNSKLSASCASYSNGLVSLGDLTLNEEEAAFIGLSSPSSPSPSSLLSSSSPPPPRRTASSSPPGDLTSDEWKAIRKLQKQENKEKKHKEKAMKKEQKKEIKEAKRRSLQEIEQKKDSNPEEVTKDRIEEKGEEDEESSDSDVSVPSKSS